jgi:polyphosphate kinase
MERNLDRRVEVVCRVRDRHIVRHIRDVVLDAYLRDSDRAYVLTLDRYEQARADLGTRVNAQQELIDWYISRPPSSDAADQ